MNAQFEQIEMIHEGKKYWITGEMEVYQMNGFTQYHDEINWSSITISEVFDENGDFIESEIKEDVACDFIIDKFALDNAFYETIYDQFVEYFVEDRESG